MNVRDSIASLSPVPRALFVIIAFAALLNLAMVLLGEGWIPASGLLSGVIFAIMDLAWSWYKRSRKR